MATMEELLLRPEDLKNVRVASLLDKRSGRFPRPWRSRYVVLSSNFLFVYTGPHADRPCRVVCLDEATVAVRGGDG